MVWIGWDGLDRIRWFGLDGMVWIGWDGLDRIRWFGLDGMG